MSQTQRIRDAETRYMAAARLASERAEEIAKLKEQIKRLKLRLSKITQCVE